MYMSNTYIKQLANLMQMLHNLDRDLNLVAFNETEKKFTTPLLMKFITMVNVIFLM